MHEYENEEVYVEETSKMCIYVVSSPHARAFEARQQSHTRPDHIPSIAICTKKLLGGRIITFNCDFDKILHCLDNGMAMS